MNFGIFSCPNCGANYNPAKYQCEYCGSYVFMSKEKYADFSDVTIKLPTTPVQDNGKYPGIYVYGRLLGKGEKPITMGAANYYTGAVAAGGKLLLTNKSLAFSAHSFNVGRQETNIDLKEVTDVKVVANFLISQHILVTAGTQSHKFVVYHGSDWVQKIKEAINACDTAAQVQQNQSSGNANYIAELQQLKALMDAGVITEEEFNIKKRMILGI